MMKKQMLAVLLAMAAAALPAGNPHEELTKNFILGKAPVESISVLSFGPEGILFIGDSKAGKIVAIDTDDRVPNPSTERFTLEDVEAKLGSLLGVGAKEVLIHDFAVNPISQNVYLAASRSDAMQLGVWKLANDIAYATILLRIMPDGSMSEFSFDAVKHSVCAVPNVIEPGKENWRKSDERTDAITDLAYDDGKLYVAGLSNEAFASALRVVRFPFEAGATHATLEVYHVAHRKSETEAPVRTLIPYTLDNQKFILASYTCTPFVSIPVDEIKAGAHVKVKTLAEFGSGNMPVDIVRYTGNGDKEYLVMSNSNKTLIRIDPEQIRNMKKGLTEPMADGQYTTGLPHDVLSGQGISHIDNLNGNHILILQRQPNGRLDLQSLRMRR